MNAWILLGRAKAESLLVVFSKLERLGDGRPKLLLRDRRFEVQERLPFRFDRRRRAVRLRSVAFGEGGVVRGVVHGVVFIVIAVLGDDVLVPKICNNDTDAKPR